MYYQRPLPLLSLRCLLALVRLLFVLLCPFLHASPAIESIAGKRTVFLGDSITQAGTYVSFTSYYLQRLHPEKDFDIYPLGLGSETVSGLSEEGHAGGRFPRPSLFERLDRALAKVKPEIIFYQSQRIDKPSKCLIFFKIIFFNLQM